MPSVAEQAPSLPDWLRDLSATAYGRLEPWTADSIGDVKNLAAPRLTHRYPNRALLHTTTLCALTCRFCFRKSHLNEKESALYEGSFDAAFEYLNKHPEVTELVLTGGDPLSLTDLALERLLDRINGVAHLRTIRLHSRAPVTSPDRIQPELLDVLKRFVHNSSKTIQLVTHFNHPLELSPLALERLRLLRLSGISLFNQTVLMRRVNNEPSTLSKLYQTLYENGVGALYLHHPDWTPGTFHFRVTIPQGQAITRALRGQLSGPAMPDYVLDSPEGDGKIPLTDSHWLRPVSERITRDGFTAQLFERPRKTASSHESHTRAQFYLDAANVD